jgi:hypothetical protein
LSHLNRRLGKVQRNGFARSMGCCACRHGG